MDNDLDMDQQVSSGRLKGIIFSILSEEDASKISATVVGAVNEVSDPALGLPNPNSNECLTCGAKRNRECEGHFGLINLPYTILNPYFMSEVAQILNKICPGCKFLRHHKVKKADSASIHHQPRNCKYCTGRLRDRYPPMKFRVSSKDMFAKTAIVAEVNEKFINNSSEKVLASDYWDVIPQESSPEEGPLQSNIRVLSHVQVYSILKDVCPTILEAVLRRKNSIFLSSMLVTPNSHRVREFGHRITLDESTRMYRKLIDFRGTPNELGARVLDRYKISKIRAEKLSPMHRIYSENKSTSDASNTSGLKHIKELLLGKRTNHAFRMVVVGDSHIKVDEIGVPVQIAGNLLIQDHLNLWNWDRIEPCCDFMLYQKGEISVLRNGKKLCIRSKYSLEGGDIIYRPLIDGDVLLINRPPSIHQHSLIALYVKILPTNSVLSVNPIICSPLRGDFDGDCLHGYVPQSVDSRVELNELVGLDKQLINGQSGHNLLSLSHDSLTAAHLILEDGVFLNKSEMQQLQMFCHHQLQLPEAASSENSLWTGKQLFSLLLPSDFEFVYPSNNVHISKGELITSPNGSSWLRDSKGNLFDCLLRYRRYETLDFLFAAQEVLCEWLSRRGLSVSLADLCLSSNPYSQKNLIDEVSCGLQEAERLSYIRLLMVSYNQDFLVESSEENEKAVSFGKQYLSVAQQMSAALSQTSISAFKQVFRDIQNLVYQYGSSDNSFLAMLNAGSKGNVQKLVQHSMCLGLQHSLVSLSFRIPDQLSCTSWNYQKSHCAVQKSHGIQECSELYIPCTVVANSFRTGLNPLECFAHSLTTRDSSFSGHADVSGTITRRLMFFMRDLVIGYDGTVRNAYGNQIVQFSYGSDAVSTTHSDSLDALNKRVYVCNSPGGHPVGSLAACAISEASYSALDQPVSVFEPSPLLALKKVLECGVKKSTGDKSASLFLSRRLGRWANGFEYGALEVKDQLERVLFSDVVSEVAIFLSSQTYISTRVCHFHIDKEVAKKKRLKLRTVIDALYMKYDAARVKSKMHLPNLKIISKGCSESDLKYETGTKICITAALTESASNLEVELGTLREVVIPVLLQTVIKGFSEFKKVDILWRERPNRSKFLKGSSGEVYLRIFMSEHCDRTKFWSILNDKCYRIRNIIDWERSHPDDVHDISQFYGIDVAWKYFVESLNSAICDTGKTILPDHLVVTANCLSATGEFVALNAKGLAQQRKETSVSSPFSQACFLNPSDCFVKAAKTGQTDRLQGSLEALAWGQTPSIGTGGGFDIIYNGKGDEAAEPIDVYSLLSTHVGSTKHRERIKLPVKQKETPGKSVTECLLKGKGRKNLTTDTYSQYILLDDIHRISRALQHILHEYPIDHLLTGEDKSAAMRALQFHPRFKEKIGTGAMEIKIGRHPKHVESRCFVLIRTDGTVEDFSYHKCIHHALEMFTPQKAKAYRSRWLNGAIRSENCKGEPC
ncbi:DNA-directed RNA polymerase IV subunit 1 isoform X1 [Olea europaea subsp. europaea]|uniref:DNA-directed RNA polymerase n=1 Tax=Olea europaea subsp. europaea TaxID=158383 RepID=A0A8S0TQG5_OLEEU|nr:DNA-directed RNA polymerase IV subunit 1 isoform X1 [Olea europaea subsp. europaea]